MKQQRVTPTGATTGITTAVQHAANGPHAGTVSSTTQTLSTPHQGFREQPSAAREAHEMLPAQLDDATGPEAVETMRHTTDNTAGYDAGTASRGGGSGGTTEAMTGGLAAGGLLGDERRSGLGDIARGQM